MSLSSYSYAAKKTTTPTTEAKKEIAAKIDKDSRKTAKDMEKDGWQTLPGRVSMEKQIEQSRIAELSVDADGDRIYITGSHQAVGGHYTAAKNAAMVRAKAELAGNLKNQIKQAISDKNRNTQIDPTMNDMLDETIVTTIATVDLDLLGVNNLLEIFRNTSNNQCEVMITLSVKSQSAVDQILAQVDRKMAGSNSGLKFK